MTVTLTYLQLGILSAGCALAGGALAAVVLSIWRRGKKYIILIMDLEGYRREIEQEAEKDLGAPWWML